MIIPATYNKRATALVGGKAGVLLHLKEAGYPVPDFVVLPSTFFEESRKKQKLHEDVHAILGDVFQQLGDGGLYAVRSSAMAEDSREHSFAGQFKTLLNVGARALATAIVEVWASIQSESVSAYMRHMGINNAGMAVIVQKMIPADVSGVGFSINPLTGNRDEQVINITTGTGDALVSGEVTGDSYIIRAGVVSSENVTDKALLADEQLLQVSDMLTKLAAHFGTPQDIEFAFVGSEFFLLQSRPVTTTLEAGPQIVWDNSNIIESYPGLTMPLTFTFIEKMYGAVYKQLSMVLGISKKKVAAHHHIYDNMLGLLNGRVYYNLNSWYKALSLLPGYRLNAAFMEKMMGVKDKPEIDISNGQERATGIGDYFAVANALVHIVYNALTVRKQKRYFVDSFNAIYNSFRNKDYSKNAPEEIWADYTRFERLMSAEWKAPLVNDFFAMIYFGVLQKLCAKYAPNHKDLHNQLIASSKDIITTEPLKLLPELANVLAKDEALKKVLITKSPAEVWDILQNPEYNMQLQAVNTYLDKWGERCVAELKLETVTYAQSPEMLVEVLQQYIRDDIQYKPSENGARGKADATIAVQLRNKPMKRFLFNHILQQARYLISNRENLRFYRTKGFGMVRKMMLAIGKQLERQGILYHSQDVFYLELDEVDDICAGLVLRQNVQKIIADRKEEYRLFEQLPLPERVVTNGKQRIILHTQGNMKGHEQLKELQGIPCSAGVVSARVCKVTAAGGNFPRQQVMATYATDPGYVVMFPAVSGILTERGSLLSHAAIVSREMGIPCIVGIEGLMEQLNDGDEIIMDGSTGVVKIIR